MPALRVQIPQVLKSKLPKLTTLHLSLHGALSNAMGGMLGDALKINTNLTLLHLNCDLNAALCRALGDLVKTNTMLRELRLADRPSTKQLCDELGKPLVEALRANASLEKLELLGRLSSACEQALFEALKTNTTLTTLRLGVSESGFAPAGSPLLS